MYIFSPFHFFLPFFKNIFSQIFHSTNFQISDGDNMKNATKKMNRIFNNAFYDKVYRCPDDGNHLIPKAHFTGEFNGDVYICSVCKKEMSGFELFQNNRNL